MSLELLDCPKFAVRSIIGRNGQEVNRLERDTRTWIDINKIVDPCKITKFLCDFGRFCLNANGHTDGRA